MKNYTTRLTNAVSPAKLNKVKLTHLGNYTTNSVITPAMFKRECDMYDADTLPTEHDRYLGETNE